MRNSKKKVIAEVVSLLRKEAGKYRADTFINKEVVLSDAFEIAAFTLELKYGRFASFVTKLS